MLLIIFITFTCCYVALAKRVVRFLTRYGSKARRLAILFFVLLPFVDVLAGYVAYYSIANFKAGRFVYEKTTQPVSVCIDDTVMSYGLYVRGVTEISRNEYLFNEISSIYTNVEKTDGRSIAEKTGLNKFYLDEKDVLRSKSVKNEQCDFKYVSQVEKVPLLPVYTTIAILTDVVSGKIYAKDITVSIRYIGFDVIPYFNWIRWWDRPFVKYSNNDIYVFKNLIKSVVEVERK